MSTPTAPTPAAPISPTPTTSEPPSPEPAASEPASDESIPRAGAPATTTTLPAAATTAATTPTLAATTPPPPGALPDPLFADLGTPGIDVLDYRVELNYDPSSQQLIGHTLVKLSVIDATTGVVLDAAANLEVSGATFDGSPAEFRHVDNDLTVDPPRTLVAGEEHEIAIDYRTAATVRGSAVGLDVGWFATPGGSYVLSEPDGAHLWMPANDHPSDKATWTFVVTVPSGLTGIANGHLLSHDTVEGREVWTWRCDDPMPPYLAQVITGDYELVEGTGPGGLALVNAVLRSDRAELGPTLALTAEQIDYFDDLFGPYPFSSYGLAVVDSPPGLAMETLGRSQFSRHDVKVADPGEFVQLLLSHELGHQWFGDSVSPEQWDDIWLNEAFATYAQWLWIDHAGLQPIEAQAVAALGQDNGRRDRPTGSPVASSLFGYASYEGGALVVHALRHELGDTIFFELLRAWTAEHRGATGSTAQFIALASRLAGRDMQPFFDQWLFASMLPSEFPA